jgi:hypothetical protein
MFKQAITFFSFLFDDEVKQRRETPLSVNVRDGKKTESEECFTTTKEQLFQ